MTRPKTRWRNANGALLGACLLAAGLVGWQLDTPTQASASDPQSAEPPAEGPPALPERPRIETLAALSETLERPLFHFTRRPPQPAPLAKPAEASAPATSFRLIGITVFGDAKIALLEPLGGGRVLRAREGQRVAEWRVLAIAPRAMTLRRAGATETLRLVTSSGQRPTAQRYETARELERPGAAEGDAVEEEAVEDENAGEAPAAQ